jgi:polyisoprenoid-binding protein YceI
MQFRLSLIVLSLLATWPALAARYTLDQSSAKLGFTVLYASLLKVPGSFDRFKGDLEFDAASGLLSTIKVEVETASINTGIAPRDHHLRDNDFFASSAFPKAVFTSQGAKLKPGVPEIIQGMLSIRGVEKPHSLTVTWLSATAEADGPSFLVETEVNRRDFGVSYGPNFLISDLVKLSIPGKALPAK